MKKIFIINGGQPFAHSGGLFQKTITEWTHEFFTNNDQETTVKVTDINQPYDLQTEVDKFIWAQLIVYHIPIWWMAMPFKLKEYFDRVFTHGHKTIYASDGRSRKEGNPKLHYGTGGLLHGRKYMLTSTWNAPLEAFTVKDEFFEQRNQDEVLIAFHKMNQFVGLSKIDGFHFHDMEKNVTAEKIAKYKQEYMTHLANILWH